MRAIKRVLNVKNFFLLAFFKIRTFFFFLNSLFFVLCLKLSRVEILPKLLGACDADTHLAGKWAFLEPSGVPVPIVAHHPGDSIPAGGQDQYFCLYLSAFISGQSGKLVAHTVFSTGLNSCLACCLLPSPPS